MKKIITTLLSLTCLYANANQETSSFEVSSQIEKSCVLSYTDLDFGVWNAYGTSDKYLDIGVKCNPGVAYILNGEMAPLINAPNGVGTFGFILPMRKYPNPHPTQYLGYRIHTFYGGKMYNFGNGQKSESGFATKNVQGIGTGNFVYHNFLGRIWGYDPNDRYVIVEAGTYTATYHFSLDY